MLQPELELLGEAVADFLQPTQRELRRRAATGRVESVAIDARSGTIFRLGEWPRERDASIPPGRIALFAASAAASFKAARDFGLIEEEDQGDVAVSKGEWARNVAVLQMLSTTLTRVVEQAREEGARDVLQRAESALDRTLQLADYGRSAIGETPVPSDQFPLGTEFPVESVFRDTTRTPAPAPQANVPSSAHARAASASQATARSRLWMLIGAISTLVIVGVIEFHYLSRLGAPPPPTPAAEVDLSSPIAGTTMLPAQRGDRPAFARVVVGPRWTELDEEGRRNATFTICQILAGHSYESAVFTATDGSVVAQWTAMKILLTRSSD